GILAEFAKRVGFMTEILNQVQDDATGGHLRFVTRNRVGDDATFPLFENDTLSPFCNFVALS
ncbi:MAG: hypothetical protein ACQESH_08835, partial [Campylobacterota bacterium]